MKIKFGAIVTDGRGKLGGHVFSKNRAGSYMRTKVTPNNPRTIDQTLARALFGAISASWSGLSDSVRESWNTAVGEWQKTNIFGDLKNPSGKALFQRLNNQAQSAGLPAITTVPAKLELPDAPITASTINTTSEVIGLTGYDTAASTRVMLFASPKVSDGTSNVSNKMRNIYNVSGSTYSSATAWTSYVAKFGTPVVGDNIFIGLKYVLASGQASPLQIVKATITA